MRINEIITNGGNVTLAISASDLKEWHKEVIESTKKELASQVANINIETYLTANQVCTKLNVDPSTLWRWEKRNYLTAIRVGGNRRYKLSDVESILEGGKK